MESSKTIDKLKNIFWPKKEGVGAPVYLQENGDLLGQVSKVIRSDDGENVGYLIDSNGVELRFPEENLEPTEGGFIYQPIWFVKGNKIVKQLKAQERINPDIVNTLESNNLTFDETVRLIKDSSSSELSELVKEAKELSKTLLSKKRSLGQQKDELTTNINSLAEDRVIGEGNRREFAEKILGLKRKARIVNFNLKKVESLIEYLKNSPFIGLDDIQPIDNYSHNTNTSNKIQKSKGSSQMNEKNPQNDVSEPNPKSRNVEGERIKKIRILKLEKNLAQKQEQIAEKYIKDRLKQINTDLDDLKQIAKENKDNKKTLEFVKNKRKKLREEKKKLQEQLKNVKQSMKEEPKDEKEIKNIEDNQADVAPEIKEGEHVESVEQETSSGLDATLIARVGSIILIVGLIIVLVFSLLGKL